MSTEIKIPWAEVVVIVSRLLKFSKGGINRDEGKELISLLAVLGTQIAVAVGDDDEPVSKPKRKK
jgi:hypothetical protein